MPCPQPCQASCVSEFSLCPFILFQCHFHVRTFQFFVELASFQEPSCFNLLFGPVCSHINQTHWHVQDAAREAKDRLKQGAHEAGEKVKEGARKIDPRS